MARLRTLFITIACLASGCVGCANHEFNQSVHQWGIYNVCVTRIADTCHLTDGGCNTQQYLQETLPLGVLPLPDGGGQFMIARDPLSPISGIQSGTNFDVVHDVAQDGTQQAFCGCPVDIVETIHGQLTQTFDGPLPTCMAPDGGDAGSSTGGPVSCVVASEGFQADAPDDAGCTFSPPPPSPFFPECAGSSSMCVAMPADAGDDCSWLSQSDAGIDIATSYRIVQGRIIDWVTPVDGGTCGCAPCMIVYDFAGSQ